MSKNQTYWLFTIAVFLLILIPSLVQDGMFLDGVTYAAISKNMANGIGSFWHPYYTATMDPDFHSHPPLALFIQSLFFRLLGDGMHVERIYTFLTAIATSIGLITLWNLNHKGDRNNAFAWVPVLMWITIPIVFWSYKNNMLENTLGVFTIFSVYLILKSLQSKNIQFLFISALLILFAILSKGPVGLFPLAVPLIYAMIYPDKRHYSSLQYFGYLLLFVCVLIIVLFLVFPESFTGFKLYLDRQIFPKVITSAESINIKRFTILIQLILELIIPILLLIILIMTKNLKSGKNYQGIHRQALLYLLIAISASFPIMLSMKQSRVYFVPAIPFYVLSASQLLLPVLRRIEENVSERTYLVFKYFTVVLFMVLIIFTSTSLGNYSRDEDKLKDIYKISGVVPPGSIIQVPRYLITDYTLAAYLSRISNISLHERKGDYLLLYSEDNPPNKQFRNFKELDLNLNNYTLLKK